MSHDWNILHYNTVESTQKEAKALVDHSRCTDGLVVLANKQTHGKGKVDRVWKSEQDLMFTLILDIEHEHQFQLTYVMAIAVSSTIEFFMHKKKMCHVIEHKWVNDVLVNGLKISGILLEQYKKFLLIGVGVNFVSKIHHSGMQAIGLADLTLHVKKKDFLQHLLKYFFFLYRDWQTFGFVKIRMLWLEKALSVGSVIQLTVGTNKQQGIFVGINENGALQLMQNSIVSLIYAGDVFLDRL